MNEAITWYKKFIDDLVSPLWSKTVIARWVHEWGTDEPKSYVTPDDFNQFMAGLSAQQRNQVAELVQRAYEEGTFNVLKYLSEEIWFGKVRFSVNHVDVPVEPFGMTLYEDWIGRKEGDYEWPDISSSD